MERSGGGRGWRVESRVAMLWGSDGRDGYWSYWMGEVVAFVLSWPTRFCLSSLSVDLPPPAVKPLPPATCHTCHKKVTGTGGTSASSRTRQDSICFHHTNRLPSRASRPLCVCPTATPIDVPQWQPSSKLGLSTSASPVAYHSDFDTALLLEIRHFTIPLCAKEQHRRYCST